jgi:hypothetical protein
MSLPGPVSEVSTSRFRFLYIVFKWSLTVVFGKSISFCFIESKNVHHTRASFGKYSLHVCVACKKCKHRQRIFRSKLPLKVEILLLGCFYVFPCFCCFNLGECYIDECQLSCFVLLESYLRAYRLAKTKEIKLLKQTQKY